MKQSQVDHIKQVATEAAQELLSTAQAAASALNAKTSTDIEWIRSDIKEIKEKLDGKFLGKDEFSQYLKEHDISHSALIYAKEDHETRIRALERWVWSAIGIIAFAEVAISIYVAIHRN